MSAALRAPETTVIEERIGPAPQPHGLSAAAWHRVLAVATPVALILVWEALARAEVIDIRFFPAPSAIFESFLRIARTGELLQHIRVSGLRILAGFFAGAVPAVILGLLMGLIPWLRSALSQVIAGIYPIPKSALLPLFLLMFGVGETSKIVLLSAGVFFPVLINTVAGALGVPRIYLDVGSNFGARGVRFYRTVVLPWALPVIFAGLKNGMNIAMVLIVIAEIAGATGGIGFMIWRAWLSFDIEMLYVGLLVIATMGILVTLILETIQRLLIPWRL